MLHNKENAKMRGNGNGGARRLAFGRRRKSLHVDPDAPVKNSFFGTVGSPIKAPAADARLNRRPVQQRGPAEEVGSEVATMDVKQKAALREEVRRQQKAKVKAELVAQQKQAAKAALAKQQQEQQQQVAAGAGTSEVATVKKEVRRRERRNSTEFIGSTVEPVQQLKLDGAKRAKIPHFLSAWFNAGNDTKDATGNTTADMTTEGDSSADNATDKTVKEDDVETVRAGAKPAKKMDDRPVNAPINQLPKPAAAVVAKDKNIAAVANGASAASAAAPRHLSQSIDFAEITLGRMIGEGAFGKVHEAKWRGKSVAVKMLICQDLRKDILSEFMSEVEIMSVLRHPNICRLLGACLEPPNRALVVELLQRGSLWGVLRTHRKSIDQDMRSRFIYDTAKGMSYLHHFERPILHRDLKSPNLLVDKNFNIKLSDFGLARVKAHVQTMTGNCGTVQWMAPEVLGNQKYTEKADVFSFGIVIWEIVCGECPYDGMAQIQVALGVLNRNLRPNIPRDCPPFFSRLMKACWNRQPELRPSFPHIVNAFRSYQSSISDSRVSSSAAASAQAAMAASVAAS